MKLVVLKVVNTNKQHGVLIISPHADTGNLSGEK